MATVSLQASIRKGGFQNIIFISDCFSPLYPSIQLGGLPACSGNVEHSKLHMCASRTTAWCIELQIRCTRIFVLSACPEPSCHELSLTLMSVSSSFHQYILIKLKEKPRRRSDLTNYLTIVFKNRHLVQMASFSFLVVLVALCVGHNVNSSSLTVAVRESHVAVICASESLGESLRRRDIAINILLASPCRHLSAGHVAVVYKSEVMSQGYRYQHLVSVSLLTSCRRPCCRRASSKDYVNCNSQVGDYVLYNGLAEKSYKVLQKVSLDLPISTSSAIIHCIQAIDIKADGNAASVSVTSGGLNMNYVTLHFESQRGHGVHFNVTVRGR
uniref:Uncharacterized protein n=1 Tax=Timema douglasi TaxID=61478 RepID=A0A7R8VU64_TIMDO|nr:unnamed protein product [Timema douglasi]